MPPDLVRPLKMESPAAGGTQFDIAPVEMSPLQDAIPMAAAYLQDPTTSAVDRAAYVDRVGASLRFSDSSTSHILGELVSATTGQVGSHDALRDLQHFLADAGPGPGFPSGCYLARVFSGPLLQSETWYTSSAQTLKILSRTLAYASGSPVPSSVTWTIFSAQGAALKTLTDTYIYFGPVPYGVTRTWS